MNLPSEVIKQLRPEEVTLLELLSEYKQISNKVDNAVKDINRQIEELIAVRSGISKPYLDILNDIEAKIRAPMLEYKHTFISSVGKINYRKGAVRRTWNLDALDQICEAKPSIKSEIWAFREEKTGEPTISIKLNSEGK